ncbi:hypothetical protein Pla175_05520 [Pirellulimonas nuda]|uniref:MarR family transcriptional regulator n=1 Tax=Pirellulimonas nuda TaxID=2528009 RepID=A0A518D6W2_9BACT|nr:hypothetical protein [Pirellulimonas nuda]QDU87195.1 hypothetical protein Pla175_05520 [Pirellulimonas nuda]
MTPEQKRILVEMLCRTEALEAEPRLPLWASDYLEQTTELEHGPRVRPDFWGSNLTATEQRRFLRAAEQLADAGFLDAYRARGGRVTHLRLTDTGRDLAESLRALRDPKPLLWSDDQ